jgi:6-phospho-beta-glucosidase
MHLVTEYGSWRNRQMVEFFTRYARTCFEQFDGLVKYWLTFNEINILLHSPFSGAGLVFEQRGAPGSGEVSGRPPRAGGQRPGDPDRPRGEPGQPGGLHAGGGNFYPTPASPQTSGPPSRKIGRTSSSSTCKPGAPIRPMRRVFRDKGITLVKGPEDDEILRHTVDFVSFSYYASRCAAADMNAGNTSEANVVKSLRNPHIEVSEWGWGIDPWAFASPSTPCTIATRSPSSWWKTAWVQWTK